MSINKTKLKVMIFTNVYLFSKIFIYLLLIFNAYLLFRLARRVRSNEFFKRVE